MDSRYSTILVLVPWKRSHKIPSQIVFFIKRTDLSQTWQYFSLLNFITTLFSLYKTYVSTIYLF